VNTKHQSSPDPTELLYVRGALFILALLGVAYFVLFALLFIPTNLRVFLQDVFSNLSATIIGFLAAYWFLYRNWQKHRSEQESQQRSEDLAKRVAEQVVVNVQPILDESRFLTRHDRHPVPLNELGWLYHGNDILRVEAAVAAETEIWVISPHLLSDTGSVHEGAQQGISTVATVQNNLARHVAYTFIVPDLPLLRPRLKSLDLNYRGRGAYQVFKLRPEVFARLAVTEMVIYNPCTTHGGTPRVFQELPLSLYLKGTYWAELAEDLAFQFVRNATEAVEKSRTA
jgi:hypothetical protein